MYSFSAFKNLFLALSVTVGVGALSSCKNSHGFKIHRMDTQLPYGVMPEDDKTVKAASLLFDVCGYDYFDLFTLSDYARKESVKIHVNAIDSVYGSGMGREEKAIGSAFYRLSQEVPGFKTPEVYSIIIPFNQSVIVTDSIVFVGLNHYLGANYAPYEYFPDYLRRFKNRSQLPIDVVEAVMRVNIPFQGDYNSTVLEHMIYDGAITEALMQTLDIDEQSAIGVAESQMEWLDENERNIWHALIEKKMLYSTDLAIARSLLEPSPATTVLTPEAPGRAGRLTAHHLVQSYLKAHPEISYIDLLQGKVPADANFISESRYNP